MFKNIRERFGNSRDVEKPEGIDDLVWQIDAAIPNLEKLIQGLDEATKQKEYSYIDDSERKLKAQVTADNRYPKETGKAFEEKVRTLRQVRVAMMFILRAVTKYGDDTDKPQWYRVWGLEQEIRNEIKTAKIGELVDLAKKLSAGIKAIPKPMRE